MSDVHKNDRNRPVFLFGRIYWWDLDRQLDKCSVVSHCFVSDRHTLTPGCVRPHPRYVLRPARWGT